MDLDDVRNILVGVPTVRFVKVLDDAVLPTQGTPGAAAYDIYSADDLPVTLLNSPVVVSTGLKIAIPEGYVGLVCPRSGLAAKHGLTVINSPGIIDADYRGELKVVLGMASEHFVHIKRGMRIAQLLVMPLHPVGLQLVDSFDDDTERGEGGFGSTGQ